MACALPGAILGYVAWDEYRRGCAIHYTGFSSREKRGMLRSGFHWRIPFYEQFYEFHSTQGIPRMVVKIDQDDKQFTYAVGEMYTTIGVENMAIDMFRNGYAACGGLPEGIPACPPLRVETAGLAFVAMKDKLHKQLLKYPHPMGTDDVEEIVKDVLEGGGLNAPSKINIRVSHVHKE